MNAHMFAVLSDPNRLDIVELLHASPRTVNEIAGVLQLNQPQTSKHLKVLADAGVVDVTPIANKRLYTLKSQPFKDLDMWLTKFRKNWEDSFDRLEILLAKEKRKEVKKHGRK
ncbi:MAG TPA: metalloregulator ArsR/SmtB family transcription factor [Candidatus Saccharimonadales bacterium]|nr:metalloregulator ArsR/SmtB family transcription factor [Candidatus Saccharimonadales bacterium]